MTSYPVFPGVYLVYNEVHDCNCRAEIYSGNLLEINHCREGRFECEFEDDFIYLGAGDLSVRYQSREIIGSCFPLCHYHGISVIIDIDKSAQSLASPLEGVGFDIGAIANRFRNVSSCVVMRSSPALEHIFSELYSVPESIKTAYFKIKVLELLMFLSLLEPENVSGRHIPKSQVEAAKQMASHLTTHLGEHITIRQLSDRFGISETLVKTYFKRVYGVSVYSFVRTQKMLTAAALLSGTYRNVLDIAGEVGYDNASKFAKAFRDVLGVGPKEYRNGTRS